MDIIHLTTKSSQLRTFESNNGIFKTSVLQCFYTWQLKEANWGHLFLIWLLIILVLQCVDLQSSPDTFDRSMLWSLLVISWFTDFWEYTGIILLRVANENCIWWGTLKKILNKSLRYLKCSENTLPANHLCESVTKIRKCDYSADRWMDKLRDRQMPNKVIPMSHYSL